MNQQARLIQIKKMLAEKNELQTQEIAKTFAVSFDTARRDVLRLTQTGQAVRVHGGIMAISNNQVPTYLTRSHIQSPIKNKMAQAAKKYFQAGNFYFLGASTTIAQFCNLVAGINASVLTNSLDNALALMQSNFPQVSVLSGKIDKTNRFIYSPQSLAELDQVHFSTAFVGTAKVSPDGIYVVDERDAAVTGKAIAKSEQTILFAEKYKFTNHNSAPYRTCSLDQIDVVITDIPLSADFRHWFGSDTKIISISEV